MPNTQSHTYDGSPASVIAIMRAIGSIGVLNTERGLMISRGGTAETLPRRTIVSSNGSIWIAAFGGRVLARGECRTSDAAPRLSRATATAAE